MVAATGQLCAPLNPAAAAALAGQTGVAAAAAAVAGGGGGGGGGAAVPFEVAAEPEAGAAFEEAAVIVAS